MKKCLVFCAAMAAACSVSQAATWSVGNASGVPGQIVQIPLSFSGDGATQAAEIDLTFDEASLSLPVVTGEMPGANVSGQCARTTSKTVTALVWGTNALPVASQIICNIPFTIRTNATGGRVRLQASSKECVTSQGVPASCAVWDGWVDINAGQAFFVQPPPQETDALAVLLRANGPAVSDLVELEYATHGAQAPLEGLRRGVLRVRPPNTYAAAGDHLRRLQRDPDSPEAKSERYIYVDFEDRESREKALALLTEDPSIETVEVVVVESMGGDGAFSKEETHATKAAGVDGQDFLSLLGLDGACARARGWGLVGVLDNGLSTNHPQLRSFTGAGSVAGNYVPGGNYLPFLSRNVGGRAQPINNLEEIQPSSVLYAIDEQCDPLDGADDGFLTYPFAGHGTHVAGLVGANGLDGAGVRGA